MSTMNSKGGYIRPPRDLDKVNILLVGSQASDADEIKRELGIVTGLACSAWYCSDPGEAMDFMRQTNFGIDIIFLDLSLFNSRYPKEYFLQLKQNIPDIPIIVLTDRTDYDLQHFVMNEGAADNISQWQLRSDPGRLRNIVESCRARDKISRREHEKSAADLKKAYAQGDADLLKAQEDSDAVLKKAADDYSVLLQHAQDENIQLRRDNSRGGADLKRTRDKGAMDLREALEKGDADMLEARRWSEEALSKSRAEYAINLQCVNDENAQLRRDKTRDDVVLKETVDRAAAELRHASEKSDAILKYARDKGALDLKKVCDVNKELRKENEHARSALSGSYSVPCPGEDDPKSANKNELKE